jgi:phage gp46-like protein
MSAIRTSWDADRLFADWLFGASPRGQDLDTQVSLETAVVLSLFTDRVALADDVLPDASGDRRGWWAETGVSLPNHMGSRLWLFAREKRTEAVRLRLDQAVRESLAWLVRDRAARKVDVTVTYPRNTIDRVDIAIVVWKADGRRLDLRYELVWQELGG